MSETTGVPQRLRTLWQAPDEAEVVESGGEWTTWKQLRELVDSITTALDDLGLGPGARIGVPTANRPESVAAVLAAWSTGRCVTSLNPLQPPARLVADLERAAPPVLLAPPETWQTDGLAAAAAATGTTALAVDGTTVRRVGAAPEGPAGPARPPGDSPATAPGVAVELNTSGTTGPPKRIPLTYRQLAAALQAATGHMRPTRHERQPFTGGASLVTVPMAHIGGLWAVFQSLMEQRRMAMLDRFTVDGWVDLVRRHRPRIAGLPPAAMRSVLDAGVPADHLAGLRAVTAGTAPVPPELAEEFLDRYGIPVLVVYGATEFSGAVAGWSLHDHRRWWPAKRGSVGRAFPGVRLRVVDPDGTPLPDGESGVLEISTAQAGHPDRRWTRTADLARIDADGFVWIEGRADDVIIRGGFKVTPTHIVRRLRAHPAVADAAVAGLPDPRLGQVPVAAVELRPGAPEVSGEQLRTWCRGELLPYEVPARVLVVDELPRTIAQKVARADLLALFDGPTAQES